MKATLPPPPVLEPLEPPKGDPTNRWIALFVCFVFGAGIGSSLVFTRYNSDLRTLRDRALVLEEQTGRTKDLVTGTLKSCITALAEADKDFSISSRAVGILETTGNVQEADALFATIDIDAYLNAKTACRNGG